MCLLGGCLLLLLIPTLLLEVALIAIQQVLGSPHLLRPIMSHFVCISYIHIEPGLDWRPRLHLLESRLVGRGRRLLHEKRGQVVLLELISSAWHGVT